MSTIKKETESEEDTQPIGRKGLNFPSLKDSLLWKDDPPSAPAPKKEEKAPLEIVRDQFPRIANTIDLIWGSPELEGYFARLIISDREGRQGFPPFVMEALLQISRQHAQEFSFPDSVVPGLDPYSRNAFKKR